MFQSKHEQRDAQLPAARDRIKAAIEKDLAEDPSILALFYGGSVGKGNSDRYSDIDLRIIVADDMFDMYREKMKQRANRWGNVLFYEEMPLAYYCTFHYDSFVKVDLFQYRLKDVLPSFWLRHIEIFYDATGMLEDVVQKSKELVFDPTTEDVQFWRTKFFASVHELYRRVMRGELYYALSCLDTMRFLMTVGWYMEMGIQPNALGDWAKIEGSRSLLTEAQQAELAAWGCGRDEEELMYVAEKIVQSFKQIHASLCAQVGLKEDEAWVDDIMQQVF